MRSVPRLQPQSSDGEKKDMSQSRAAFDTTRSTAVPFIAQRRDDELTAPKRTVDLSPASRVVSKHTPMGPIEGNYNDGAGTALRAKVGDCKSEVAAWIRRRQAQYV